MRFNQLRRYIIMTKKQTEIPIGQEGVIAFNGISAITHQQCNRCHAKVLRWMHGPSGDYCWTCYAMGSVTENKSLCAIPENNDFTISADVMSWQGALTPSQLEISQQLCAERKESQLVHAVTGAGKTEMLYPVLEKYLKSRKRVAFVAPRVDVVHEIALRLSQVFNVTQAVMTGETRAKHIHAQLVFATIHQLFKFKEAFDLIIVDECDAFPVYGNFWLQGAISKALKVNGRLICLTATLPKGLHQQYGIQLENTLTLYRRFHGYPLPNIQIHYCGNWRKKVPQIIMNMLRSQRHPILIFLPEIKDCVNFKHYLEDSLEIPVGIVYAGSEKRMETIKAFKEGEIRYLITTILLERGVTFPGIDVMIVGAESAVFSTASLIQIAGRCGRTKERPTGNVHVYTRWKLRKIIRVYREIKRMNK